jgi:esterase
MQLNFRHYPGPGNALLILHGLFGNLANWNWQSQEFCRHFSVYALDMRNHGSSPHNNYMNYPAMANDVLEFLDNQEIARCDLIGHSMGGKIAMQITLSNPDRVDRLVVADIAPVAYPAGKGGHDEVFDGLEAVDLATVTSRREAEQSMKAHIREEAVRQFLLANLLKDDNGNMVWRFNLTALKANYDALRENVEVNAPCDKPVLFVKGQLSNYIQERHRGEMLRIFPHSEIVEVEGAGHWLHAEKAQAFNTAVKDFLLVER